MTHFNSDRFKKQIQFDPSVASENNTVLYEIEKNANEESNFSYSTRFTKEIRFPLSSIHLSHPLNSHCGRIDSQVYEKN